MTVEARPAETRAAREASRWSARLSAARKRPLFIVSLILLSFLVVLALAGPTLQPFDPSALAGKRFEAPSAAHWFGTDDLGRDVLSRCIAGARLSLTIGLLTSIGGTTIGSIIGGVSGYWGGKIDLVVQRFIDALQAIPTIVLALAIVSVIGSSPRSVIVVGWIVFIPGPARIVRSTVLQAKEFDFVSAAVSIGASHMRIMVRHVAPQALAPYFILLSLAVGGAILLESALSFLGVGPPPPSVSWGKMIGGDARVYIESAPWALLAPAAFLTTVVYAFNLAGDSLRDMLDPRLRGS